LSAAPQELCASDGQALFTYCWSCPGSPRAIVQIAHGMGEHAQRYAEAAGRLAAAGLAVIAHDLRGHGPHAPARELGYLGEDGWRRALLDLDEVGRAARRRWPGRPRLLLGHSMGAVLVKDYLGDHGQELTGAALSGCPVSPEWLRRAGLWAARLERWRLGERGQSALLEELLFGPARRRFPAGRTRWDWLSRDALEVERYVADPACGFALRAGSLCELLEALGRVHSPRHLARLPRGLPLYAFSGECDPLHRERFPAVLGPYRQAGLERLSERLYAHDRHEPLHELDRQAVARDLLDWIGSCL
jgi:alpha-beta hydrolase superfamily lysophospholipase